MPQCLFVIAVKMPSLAQNVKLREDITLCICTGGPHYTVFRKASLHEPRCGAVQHS